MVNEATPASDAWSGITTPRGLNALNRIRTRLPAGNTFTPAPHRGGQGLHALEVLASSTHPGGIQSTEHDCHRPSRQQRGRADSENERS